LVEPAQAHAGHHRGAGAGAAGQRLAGIALVHAQRDMAAVQHLQEADVDLAREARCCSMRGPSAATGASRTSSTR
jgi:hypothetical protein